ncbi:MAG: efflux transporter outer membrane subunit [Verrucomicrobiota bacterium]
MSWEIDLWGRIRAATSASVADFEASEFDFATAQLSLAGQATKAWFALAEARDQVALTRSTLATFRSTEQLIRDRFETGVEENGRSFASELLLAEGDVARAIDNLNSQEELVGRSARQLEVLAGEYPAGVAGGNATLPSFPGQVPADLPASLLDRRPDLAAAERRIAGADQRLLEAKRALLPSIGLTSSFGTSSEDVSNLLNGDFSIWSIAGNIAQPILQGGRLRANISRQDAELQVAAAEFEQAALTAFAEVENALGAEQFLSNRVSALIQSARLNRAAYLRAREEFELGTGDILTVLSSQERDFTSRSQLLTVRRLRLENRVDLYLALGGSFYPRKIETTEPEKP